MEMMNAGFLEAFWSQLRFLPLDVGRYTGTCHVCPINPPLLPVAWQDNLNSRRFTFLDIVNFIGKIDPYAFLFYNLLSSEGWMSGLQRSSQSLHWWETWTNSESGRASPWLGKMSWQKNHGSQNCIRKTGGWEEGTMIGTEPKRRQESKLRQQRSKGSLEED